MSQQSMEALAMAQETRLARVELRRKVRGRFVSLHDAMEERCAQTMEIRKLLLCLPRCGEAKTLKTLRALGISPSTQVQNLSESRRRQLEELVG